MPTDPESVDPPEYLRNLRNLRSSVGRHILGATWRFCKKIDAQHRVDAQGRRTGEPSVRIILQYTYCQQVHES